MFNKVESQLKLGVRDFLDSRHGRHLADDVANGLFAGLSLSAAIDAAVSRWMGWSIGKLVEQYPEPLLEIHPALARTLGIADRDLVRVETRRGAAEFQAQLVTTIREDTVFIPYHWPGRKSANLLTSGLLDPVSKIPEFKVSACRLVPTGRKAPSAAEAKAFASV